MGWYARAIERSLRLPSAIVDRVYLKSCLQDLHDQLTGSNGQIPFHRTTSKRSARIDHRLHRMESVLLVLTLICCGLHILHNWHDVPGHQLTFCCGFFPALGAALAGIRNQGEFRRISQRSRSMERQLEKQLDKVRELQKLLDQEGELPWQLSAEIAAVAGETAQFMVNEVLGWRVIFQDQPLKAS